MLLRPAQPDDAGILFELMAHYKSHFADDFAEVTPPGVLEMIANGDLTVMDNGYGLPVGVFQLNDRCPGIRAEVHLLINPKMYKDVVRTSLITEFLTKALAHFGKLYAEPMDSQAGAIKLLKQYGFERKGTRFKHTKLQGKWQDVHLYELHRKTFRKHLKRTGGV